MSATLDTIIITRKTSFKETLTFLQGPDDDPYNLLVFDEIKMDVRRSPNRNSELVFSGSTSTGELTVLDNILEVRFTPDKTDVKAGEYYRDFRFRDGSDEFVICSGKVKVLENITVI